MSEKFPTAESEKKEVIGEIGFSEDIGTRETNEDAHVIEDNFSAVFDGHGGKEAAELSAEKLPKIFQKNLESGLEPDEAFREAFLILDSKITERDPEVGAAALAVFFKGKDFWVANAGDVRAVLVKENSEQRLSRDHKPEDPEEQKNIEKGGGQVVQSALLRLPDGKQIEIDDYNNLASRQKWARAGARLIDKDAARVGIPGLKRALSMSRALGDGWAGDAISSLPEVKKFQVESDDRRLIIACDGVWNVITDTMAADLVRDKSAMDGARALVEEINNRRKNKGQAQDNVTAIVIELNP